MSCHNHSVFYSTSEYSHFEKGSCRVSSCVVNDLLSSALYEESVVVDADRIIRGCIPVEHCSSKVNC